jgi:hypothetical protein
VFTLQEQAIAAAKSSANRQGTELIITGEDAEIREKLSYGNDPNPPRA